MKKYILPIFLLFSIFFMNSCSYMGLKPHGDIVINVITTKETNEWEEKNESDKKYYAIYSNGIYQETDKFKADDVNIYHVDPHETFLTEIVGNKIVNTVVKPTVTDNNNNLITPDENMINIINATANSIEHDIWKFEIFKDNNKYFAFIWLNVNWCSPCELYEYDIDKKSIYQLCEWDEIDIVGISVPDSINNFSSDK